MSDTRSSFVARDARSPLERRTVAATMAISELICDRDFGTAATLNALINVFLRLVVASDQVEAGLEHVRIMREVLADPVKRAGVVGRIVS